MKNISEYKGLIMKVIIFSFLAVIPLSICGLATGTEAKTMDNDQTLDQKQKSIITIAAFTADGNIGSLKTSLNQGLDAGLTVNEIKELLVHLYAYAGFPRSLNGINTFMQVLDERKAKGIEDALGKEATPVPPELERNKYGAEVRAKLAGMDEIPPPSGYQLFAPVIDTFLKEHLFADIFARDVISYQDRELATISALSNMTGTGGQLYFHMGAAMNTGLTEAQMRDFITILASNVDEQKAAGANAVLDAVLKTRK